MDSLISLIPEGGVEGIILILVTSVAAIISNILDKKNKKPSPEESPISLIQTAFEEMKSTIDDLREYQDELKDDVEKLADKVDKWKTLYYDQLEENKELKATIETLEDEEEV